MNSDVMTPAVQVDPAIWQTLQAEVKETLAAEIAGEKSKKQSFSVVDMWNIRRQAKSSRHLIRR